MKQPFQKRRIRYSGAKTAAMLLSLLLTAGACTLPVVAGKVPSTNETVGAIPSSNESAKAQKKSTVRVMEDKMVVGRAHVEGRIRYRYPAGAMAVTLFVDGQRAMPGEVVDIGGTVYVPVQRFADRFGRFRTVYDAATEQVVITGTNLEITVRVGDPYITVNDRILYTGQNVLSLGGWIFVPLEPMVKAVGATAWIQQGWYRAYVTSGDPTSVPHADEVYDEGELYWLSRIISAESQGEPMRGRIAVGNVVLNRQRSSSFPNTVYGVIFDKKHGTQFAPTAIGTVYNTPTEGSVVAAKICLEGYTLSDDMLYFFNPAYASGTWIEKNRPYITTIGNHKFFG